MVGDAVRSRATDRLTLRCRVLSNCVSAMKHRRQQGEANCRRSNDPAVAAIQAHVPNSPARALLPGNQGSGGVCQYDESDTATAGVRSRRPCFPSWPPAGPVARATPLPASPGHRCAGATATSGRGTRDAASAAAGGATRRVPPHFGREDAWFPESRHRRGFLLLGGVSAAPSNGNYLVLTMAYDSRRPGVADGVAARRPPTGRH